MNNNYEKNNVVHISGIISEKPQFSHSVLSEGFYDMKLTVPRLSAEHDVVPVTISERLLKDYKEGDSISINGQFRSYNKMVDGKSKLMLTVFAKETEDSATDENPNFISLSGYICKEPIYRTTPFGREICDVLIAVNRAYNKSDYLPCIAWGRNARFVKDLQVGEKIEIQGRIQSRNYQKKINEENTETRTAFEVSISSVAVLSGGNEQDVGDVSYIS